MRMANSRVLGLLAKLVSQIGCSRYTSSASNVVQWRKNQPKGFYRAVVNAIGAQAPNKETASKGPQNGKRVKSGYVSTMYRRNVKPANFKQISAMATSKPMVTAESVSALTNIRRRAVSDKTSLHDKNEVKAKNNFESANHALVLARFNNPYKHEHYFGVYANNDQLNLGVVLKNYQGKGNMTSESSFADYVKKAQIRLLGFSKTGMYVPPKAAATPKIQQERRRKLVATGLATNITKQLFPSSSKKSATSIVFAGNAQKKIKTSRPTEPQELEFATFRNRKDYPKGSPKEPQQRAVKYAFRRPISAPAKMQYQPSKWPTMKTLNKVHKAQEHGSMALIRNQKLRPLHADDGKKASKKRPVPVFKIAQKNPINESAVKKTRRQFNFLDTAQACKLSKSRHI